MKYSRNGISLGATSILWSENHGKYSMYGIDFPRAFGLASENVQKKLVWANGCDQSSAASHRLRTTTSSH
jgi:hypothetical protein